MPDKTPEQIHQEHWMDKSPHRKAQERVWGIEEDIREIPYMYAGEGEITQAHERERLEKELEEAQYALAMFDIED